MVSAITSLKPCDHLHWGPARAFALVFGVTWQKFDGSGRGHTGSVQGLELEAAAPERGRSVRWKGEVRFLLLGQGRYRCCCPPPSDSLLVLPASRLGKGGTVWSVTVVTLWLCFPQSSCPGSGRIWGDKGTSAVLPCGPCQVLHSAASPASLVPNCSSLRVSEVPVFFRRSCTGAPIQRCVDLEEVGVTQVEIVISKVKTIHNLLS